MRDSSFSSFHVSDSLQSWWRGPITMVCLLVPPSDFVPVPKSQVDREYYRVAIFMCPLPHNAFLDFFMREAVI
jgi:hypothetical protein